MVVVLTVVHDLWHFIHPVFKISFHCLSYCNSCEYVCQSVSLCVLSVCRDGGG